MSKLPLWRPVFVVSASFVLTVLCSFLLAYVKFAGPFHEALFWPSRLDQGEKIVDNIDSFNPGEINAFVIPFLYEGKYQKRDLKWVVNFTEKLEKAFPEFAVYSLSNMTRYRAEGQKGDITVSSYIDQSTFKDFDSEKWRQQVNRDEKVGGLFLAHDGTSVTVLMALEDGAQGVAIQRRIIEFLEGRDIPWWKWYYKRGITLADEFTRTYDEDVPEKFLIEQSEHQNADGSVRSVLPAGWGLGRIFLTGGMVADVFMLMPVCVILGFIVLTGSLGNYRQALIGTSVITMTLVWVIGSVVSLRMIGFEVHGASMHLTVFSVLLIAGIVVPSVSSSHRKFDSYNTTPKNPLDQSRGQTWRRSLADPLTRVNSRLILITVITVVGFLLVYFIGVRQAFGVGLFCAIGMGYLLFLVFKFLPAAHILIGGESRPGRLGRRWHGLLDRIVERAYHFILGRDGSIFELRKKGKQMVVGVVALAVLVLGTVVGSHALPGTSPLVNFVTKPLTYVWGTIVHEASEELNEPGNYGFDRTMFVLEKKPGTLSKGVPAMYDPKFWEKVHAFEKRIETDPEIETYVRYAHSAVDILGVKSREDYGSVTPPSVQAAADTVRSVATDLGVKRRSQLWSFSGETMVLLVSLPATNSVNTKRVIDRVLEIAGKDFPSFEIDPFGKNALFAWVDRQLRASFLENTVGQLFSIFLFTSVWIGWRSWRHRRCQVKSGLGADHLSPVGAGLAITLLFVFALSMQMMVIVIFGIPLDLATALLIPLTVAAVIDLSLYVVADYQTVLLRGGGMARAVHYAIRERGHVVLKDGAENIAIFLPIGLLSSFPPVSRIGWMLVVMMLFCMIGALIILPAALSLSVRRNLSDESENGNRKAIKAPTLGV